MLKRSEPGVLTPSNHCCGDPVRYYISSRAQLYCAQCDRSYDPVTKLQIENWAWKKVKDEYADEVGGWVRLERLNKGEVRWGSSTGGERVLDES